MHTSRSLRCQLLAGFAWWSAPSMAEPTVVGWIESVKLGGEGLVLPAKLDTGADTSSLHVSDIMLGEGVEVRIPLDRTICSVAIPKIVEEVVTAVPPSRPGATTCSSRSREPPRACRRSRRPSPPASR